MLEQVLGRPGLYVYRHTERTAIPPELYERINLNVLCIKAVDNPCDQNGLKWGLSDPPKRVYEGWTDDLKIYCYVWAVDYKEAIIGFKRLIPGAVFYPHASAEDPAMVPWYATSGLQPVEA